MVDYLIINNEEKNFKLKKSTINILAVLIVGIVVIPALVNAYSSYSVLKPIVNDDIKDTAVWINNSTSNETVIISSWTWGHFYTAIADRPVVFDGRLGYIETMAKRNFDEGYPYKKYSPSTSREYWIDKAYSTSNESLSIGIFKMLANKGDTTELFINNYTNNTTKSIEILNNILGVDNETAYLILRTNYNFNDIQSKEILNYSHPVNSKPFIIITNDRMINMGYWTFFFGGWNFYKQLGNNITYDVGKINLTDNITIKSTNGVIIDDITGQITWFNQTPHYVLIAYQNKTEKKYINNSSNFDIIILYDTNQTIVMDSGFENSLFTRLVFEKKNTTYLHSIYNKNSITVWVIN